MADSRGVRAMADGYNNTHVMQQHVMQQHVMQQSVQQQAVQGMQQPVQQGRSVGRPMSTLMRGERNAERNRQLNQLNYSSPSRLEQSMLRHEHDQVQPSAAMGAVERRAVERRAVVPSAVVSGNRTQLELKYEQVCRGGRWFSDTDYTGGCTSDYTGDYRERQEYGRDCTTDDARGLEPLIGHNMGGTALAQVCVAVLSMCCGA